MAFKVGDRFIISDILCDDEDILEWYAKRSFEAGYPVIKEIIRQTILTDEYDEPIPMDYILLIQF